MLTVPWRSDGVVEIAPDGFPYIGAFPAKIVGDRVPGLKEFEPRALAQLALAKHAGIAVYVRLQKDHPVYAYSLGAVTAIATDTWQPYETARPSGLQPGDHLIVGTPSADALPAELRRAIAEYMRTNDHVAAPKIATIVIKRASGEYQQPPWQMAANLRRFGFPDRVGLGSRVEACELVHSAAIQPGPAAADGCRVRRVVRHRGARRAVGRISCDEVVGEERFEDRRHRRIDRAEARARRARPG